jgi:hypothetical protein
MERQYDTHRSVQWHDSAKLVNIDNPVSDLREITLKNRAMKAAASKLKRKTFKD